jgi:hypothetical protein
MTAPSKRVNISFTIPPTLHLVIGAILAAGAAIAYAVHFALPTDDPYRESAAYVGNLAGFVAASYCVWCTSRGGRADTADLTRVTQAAIAAAAERQAGIQSTLEAATTAILLSLREIAEQEAEDRGAMKRLEEAVNGAVEAVKESAGAVEALQDCYLAEGQVLVLPARVEAPGDRALPATQEAPSPVRGRGFAVP